MLPNKNIVTKFFKMKNRTFVTNFSANILRLGGCVSNLRRAKNLMDKNHERYIANKIHTLLIITNRIRGVLGQNKNLISAYERF